jgi:hypothetical protein
MSNLWTQPTGYSLGTIAERTITAINLPITSVDAVTLIAGTLPAGLRLQNSAIVGTTLEVARTTQSRFVLRARLGSDIQDRTYSITVTGPDAPVWITPAGVLPVGENNALFILDSVYVDYQLEATDTDLSAGDELEFFIANGDGTLPPGITLTKSGQLTGVIDPILALDTSAASGTYDANTYGGFPFDFGLRSANGFESFYYDVEFYDYAIPTKSPRKLSRYYEFTVSVSDGDTITKRKFRIFVVGDDFLRADNTILQVGGGVFTSDGTYIRTPQWLTPRDLGYRRANNYVTLFLELYDPNTLTGYVAYTLRPTNDDATVSTLPPGCTLDSTSGEVAGRVPYQPAVTKEYKFTVRATRFGGNNETLAIKDKTFSVKILGEVDSVITWNTNNNLGSINANFISTLSVRATTTVPNAVLRYVLTAGALPNGLTLALDGEILGKVRQFPIGGLLGLTTFDDRDFTLDNNETSIDRTFTFTVEARDQFGYSATTRTFTLSVTAASDLLYSNLYVKPFLKPAQRTAYLALVGDPEIFTPASIYRPSDTQFGLQKQLQMLIYAGIETKTINHYVAATVKNHRRKRYKFGEIKTAVAKTPGTNNIVYEVLYVQMIDPQDDASKQVASRVQIKNNQTIRINQTDIETIDDVTHITVGGQTYRLLLDPSLAAAVGNIGTNLQIYANSGTLVLNTGTGVLSVTLPDSTAFINVGTVVNTATDAFRFRSNYSTIRVDSNILNVSRPNDIHRYISNTTNMRENLSAVGETENEFLPLWMRTAQSGQTQALGYVMAVPLCYCQPGTSQGILTALKNSDFDFKQIDFEIDRYIIDSTEESGTEQYILFPNYQYNI